MHEETFMLGVNVDMHMWFFYVSLGSLKNMDEVLFISSYTTWLSAMISFYTETVCSLFCFMYFPKL